MNGGEKNRPLVADELVEFEKKPVKASGKNYQPL
jgi:hypothetical protein